MDDKQFFNQFAAILSILIGIGVVILIIARVLSGTLNEPDQAMKDAATLRIKPVGEVHIDAGPGDAAVAAAPAAAKQPAQPGAAMEAANPAKVYQTACAACHATGIANAPIYGNRGAWETRLGNLETLYANSLNGKGAMPPKGGRPDLSDEEIKATVDYMLDAVR